MLFINSTLNFDEIFALVNSLFALTPFCNRYFVFLCEYGLDRDIILSMLANALAVITSTLNESFTARS